ncbi:MAG: phenylalanine--tRNA ligase subunit beta, partial [bacterium]|nr:phenylalanine--tRNA ligase subunit beta [bacterium]
MLISLSWLKKYVEVPDDLDSFSHELTMAGLNVERRIERGLGDPNIVTGRVLSVEKHPNADKLTLCSVDVASGDPRQIVCGAPNVAEGQIVLVALPGAKLPDGSKIRSSKIRGVKSDGMMCSERELGLGEDSGGIVVLEG